MKKLNNFIGNSLENLSLQNIFAGKKLETHLGDADNPEYTDVHYDNDNDGVWSEGDRLEITKK